MGGGAVVGEYPPTAPLIGMMPSASSPLPRIGGCRVRLGLKGRDRLAAAEWGDSEAAQP